MKCRFHDTRAESPNDPKRGAWRQQCAVSASQGNARPVPHHSKWMYWLGNLWQNSTNFYYLYAWQAVMIIVGGTQHEQLLTIMWSADHIFTRQRDHEMPWEVNRHRIILINRLQSFSEWTADDWLQKLAISVVGKVSKQLTNPWSIERACVVTMP